MTDETRPRSASGAKCPNCREACGSTIAGGSTQDGGTARVLCPEPAAVDPNFCPPKACAIPEAGRAGWIFRLQSDRRWPRVQPDRLSGRCRSICSGQRRRRDPNDTKVDRTDGRAPIRPVQARGLGRGHRFEQSQKRVALRWVKQAPADRRHGRARFSRPRTRTGGRRSRFRLQEMKDHDACEGEQSVCRTPSTASARVVY